MNLFVIIYYLLSFVSISIYIICYILYVLFWVQFIGLLLFILAHEIHEIIIYPYIKDIQNLKIKQDILHESIAITKKIIDIDKSSEDVIILQLKELTNEINKMYTEFEKRLDKIEEVIFTNKINH